MRKAAAVLAALAAAFSLSCAGAEKVEKKNIGTASEDAVKSGLTAIAGKKVFFGHQSVGVNLMDGLADLYKEAGIAAPAVAETRKASDIAAAGFYHAHVGENTKPLSKLRDFDAALRGGVAGAVDAAFLKFCYVDFDMHTDVDALFSAYRATLARLKADFPGVSFVHFTAPLTAEDSGLKATVKRLIGRRLTSDADNAARQRYNEKLRAEYGGKEPLFDLALAEAAAPDGTAEARSLDGAEFYALRREYTYDGGHLNEAGRKAAARRLAAELGKVLR